MTLPKPNLRKWRDYFFVERIYGQGRFHTTVMLTRIKLTPSTRWGQLYFHIFHRGDEDPDPHDHPWDFWTFPLQNYWEMVMDDEGIITMNLVPKFKWTKRSAYYTHRVRGPQHRTDWTAVVVRTLYTFVWHGPKLRSWGFWVLREADGWTEMQVALGTRRGRRFFVPWREYVYGEKEFNTQSIVDGKTVSL